MRLPLALLLAVAPPVLTPAPPARPLPIRRLADGVYAVLGDTGRGSEGRPNAGFVVTRDGVVVIDALASPKEGRELIATIRSVSRQPIRWLVLTHHHPDHHFGAIELRRAGARVIAHPDTRTLAVEGGEDALMADWVRVVGLDAMRGFEFADTPDRPVTGTDTLRLGGRTLVVSHPGPAHTAGDLTIWLPKERVLFAGDLLIEDGVTMVVDGNSGALLRALDAIDSLHPRVAVPGHGRIPARPEALVDSTRRYFTALRADMRAAVEQNRPMRKAMAELPPADQKRPVSLASRRRRNAVRVYLEMEKDVMGLGDSGAAQAPAPAAPAPATAAMPRLVSSDTLAAWLAARRPVRVIDIRTDVFTYLKSHLPGAVYVNTETLRAAQGGIPVQLLDEPQYQALFARLGIAWNEPVVIYSAGESHNIDATFLAWLLAGFGHPQVYVLDGGYFKWELEHRPVPREYPRFAAAAGWSGRRFRPETASLGDVRAGRATLVDARPPDQYAGEAGAQMRRGHIPGAISHYWADDLTQEGFGHVWKSRDELRASYERQGITRDKDIIAYCNSTTEASHVAFTLRYLLGYPRVRIYTGSWTEWAERPELPLATGPAPGPALSAHRDAAPETPRP